MSIMITPAMMTPISDHLCDAGAFCHDLKYDPGQEPRGGQGRMPMTTASKALLKTRRR